MTSKRHADLNSFAIAEKAERLLAEAASYGAQLVVFPEAFIGGYPRGSSFGVTIGNRTSKGKEEFRKYHSSAIDVPGKNFILFFPFLKVFHLNTPVRVILQMKMFCSYIKFDQSPNTHDASCKL